MVQHRGTVKSSRSSNWRFWAGVGLVVSYAAKVSGAMLALSTAWILFGLFSGQLVNVPSEREQQIQAFNAARITANAFQISAVVFFLSLLLLTWESKDAAIMIVIGGVCCYFVLPLVMAFQRLNAGMIYSLLSNTFTSTGLILIGLSLIRYTAALIEYFLALARGEAKLSWGAKGEVGVADKAPVKERLHHKPSVFSPCWHLPFCREAIRKVCPAFLAKKRCWKFGKGCYCDQEMITKIITGEVGERTASARAFARETFAAPTGEAPKRGKPPCGKCYIYLYHQQLKHKLISPLILPATIGIVVLTKPMFDEIYKTAAGHCAAFWQAISYTKVQPGTAMAPGPFDAAIQGLVLFLVGFLLLIWLTKTLEFCIYKLRL